MFFFASSRVPGSGTGIQINAGAGQNCISVMMSTRPPAKRRIAELGQRTPKPPPAAADEGYWLGCSFGDHFAHCAVVPESPALSSWDISRSHRGFDFSPGAMSRKADHGIPNPSTGATGLAG